MLIAQRVQKVLSSVSVDAETVFDIDDAIVDVKRQVAEAVYSWNNRYDVVHCCIT